MTLVKHMVSVDLPFCPFSICSIMCYFSTHNNSLMAYYYSYNLPFLAILKTLIEGFIQSLISTLWQPQVRYRIFIFFKITFLGTLLGHLDTPLVIETIPKTHSHFSYHLRPFKHFRPIQEYPGPLKSLIDSLLFAWIAWLYGLFGLHVFGLFIYLSTYLFLEISWD